MKRSSIRHIRELVELLEYIGDPEEDLAASMVEAEHVLPIEIRALRVAYCEVVRNWFVLQKENARLLDMEANAKQGVVDILLTELSPKLQKANMGFREHVVEWLDEIKDASENDKNFNLAGWLYEMREWVELDA